MDTNGAAAVFVRDCRTGTTRRVSVGRGGAEADDFSTDPGISPGGRYVAFTSLAGNLVPGDTNGTHDVFLRDRWNGRTEQVSVATSGGQR